MAKPHFFAIFMPKLWSWICLIKTVNAAKQLNFTFMTISSEFSAVFHYWIIKLQTIYFPVLWKYYFILFPLFSYNCEIKAVSQELPHVPTFVFTKARESGHSCFVFPPVTILLLEHRIHLPPMVLPLNSSSFLPVSSIYSLFTRLSLVAYKHSLVPPILKKNAYIL